MTACNVGDLRRLLATSDLPDDAPILVPAPDHHYRVATVRVSTAMRYGKQEWAEDCGDMNPDPDPGEESGERVRALIVGR